MLKKIVIGLLIILVVIQFIRPEKNISKAAQPHNITEAYPVPANIQHILQRACNDCHSNNTTYPWYAEIQPAGLWLAHHIDEGKAELNFDEFTTYSPKKQAHKLEEVAEMVEKGEMPLKSYTLIHKSAILNTEDAAALQAWAKGLQQTIANKTAE
jgi:hypothetical protein